jgi:hypothetical protein
MKGSKMTFGKFVKYFVSSIYAVTLWLVLCQPAVAQTAGEAITTMEVQQELMGNQTQQRIKEPNLNTESDTKNKPEKTTEAAKSTSAEKNADVVKQKPQQAATANVTDTNTPDINDFNDYKQEIARIDLEARDEESKWLGRLEKKSDLAKAMNDVVAAEMKFLRNLAEADGSEKTVDAIDLLLKKRQDRLAKLTTKLEDETKTERRERRAPRLGGAGGVGVGEQGQTMRPQRRTREPLQPANTNTNAEEQQP